MQLQECSSGMVGPLSQHNTTFVQFLQSNLQLSLFQAKLLESSHAWLGASTSSIAGKCWSWIALNLERKTCNQFAIFYPKQSTVNRLSRLTSLEIVQ